MQQRIEALTAAIHIVQPSHNENWAFKDTELEPDVDDVVPTMGSLHLGDQPSFLGGYAMWDVGQNHLDFALNIFL